MTVTIHQPEHLPWLGFFDKARQVDLLVLLDHVQYRKQYFQNRNRIRSSEGFRWLTVPILIKGRHLQSINQVEIDNTGSPHWRRTCLRLLMDCYRKACFFPAHAEFFEKLYHCQWKWLVDLNETIIRYLLEAFAISVPLKRSSELGIQARKGDLNLEICQKVGASRYLSGISGKAYLDLEKFRSEGVEVQIQAFHHPIYQQLHETFLPCMSAIDLLFNHGPRSGDILKGIGAQTLEKILE